MEQLEHRQLMAADYVSLAIPIDPNHGDSVPGIFRPTPTYYSFSVEDGGRLIAEVVPTGGASRLTLLSSDGDVLMQSDGQSASNPNDLIDLHLAGAPGGTTYYLTVEGFGGTSSFVLTTSYTATTEPFRSLPVGASPWTSTTADFNGDGKADLVVLNFDSSNMSIYFGQGDGTFSPQQQIAIGSGANGVVAQDLNHDGRLDLVTANMYDNTVSVLFGNGDGTFAPHVDYAAGDSAASVTVGDFNGDGSPDLAVADFGSDSVSILFNHGDGTFAAPVAYAVGAGPYDIVSGDFNRDGILDLATVDFSSDDVSLLLGRGDGTFATATFVSVGHQPYVLVAADFNDDGRLDIATANSGSGDVSVLLGNGDGGFAPQTVMAAGEAPTAIIAADFNGDGVLDIADGNNGDGTVSVFIGRGDGTFEPRRQVPAGSAPASLVAADFNQDGVIDLGITDTSRSTVDVIAGRGDGTFQTQPRESPGVELSQIVTADFNGDGRLDLAAVDYTAINCLTVFLGQQDGTFRFIGKYAAGSDAISVAMGDFNDDGIIDLITGNYSTANISVLLGKGDGTFGGPILFDAGSIPFSLAVGDFNGDGRLDVATANTGDNNLSILFGDGTGRFAPPVFHAAGLSPWGIVAADFNGDGFLDLAVTNTGSNDVSVFFNHGDGTFAAQLVLSAGLLPRGIVAGDFNGDGIADLAVGNDGEATASVFLSDGQDSFAAPIVVSTALDAGRLQVGDFDRDGKLDLGVLEQAADTMLILRGVGNGTFEQAQRILVGESPYGSVVGDFNGDGIADIATANGGSSDISVLLGAADGAFRPPIQVAVGSGPIAIASADFNSDGHMDVVTANPVTGIVTVSLSSGDGTFRTNVDVPLLGGIVAVTTGDFNHDGRPDIAAANYQTNTVSILLGIGDGTFELPLSIDVGRGPDALMTGDFNGDGTLDLAVANFGSDTVSILFGQTDGSFTAAQEIRVGDGPVALAIGEVEADGTTEVFAANSLSRDISILESGSNGIFRLVATVTLGTVPSSVVSGDFNHDGNLDIAATDQAGNAVTVLLGMGHENFEPSVSFAAGTGPVSIVTGDFNGDGILDLATANNNSNDVTVLLGDGDGAFQVQTPFRVGAYPSSLVASDFNDDGRLDLATANGLSAPVSVGLGIGDGTLTKPGTSFVPIQSRPIVADFNGDGIPDVVVLRGDGKILFRAGLAAGGFGAPVVINPDQAWDARDLTIGSSPGLSYLVATNARAGSLAYYGYVGGQFRRLFAANVPGALPAYFLYGDINGDGLQDGIMYLGDTGQIIVYLQHPNDDFSDRSPDFQIQVGRGVSAMTLADLDGDGRQDIIVTDESSGEVHIFLNSANAPFSSELSFRAGDGLASVGQVNGTPQVMSRDTPVALAVGLFSGDAIPDLAVLNKSANRVDILVGDGQGGVFNHSPAMSLLTGPGPTAILTADFNGDGILDLAVLNKGSSDLSIFLGNGHGGFTEQTETGPDGQKVRPGAGNSPTGVTAADLNGDGHLDLLIGNEAGDVLIVLGVGDGTFRPYQRIDRSVSLATTDLDHDGQRQFVFANQAHDRIAFVSDNPTENFVIGRQDGILDPNAVTLADLNGDGREDMIVANGGGNSVLVYLGLGGDQFGAGHRYFVGTNPKGLTVSDVNGDGILDLVVANQGSNDLSLLFGKGQGETWTFTQGPRLDAGAGPVGSVIRDVNNDGIPDILVANGDANNVYLLAGVGHGLFDDTSPVIFQTGDHPDQLFVGNFDDQAGLDLVTVNAGSNDLTFFSNLGSGRTITTNGVASVAAVAEDFNNDGISDLIVANRDGLFTLYWGGSNGLQVAGGVTLPGLSSISDMVMGSISGAAVDIYATMDGIETAFLVTFRIDQTFSLETFVAGGTQFVLSQAESIQSFLVGTSALPEAEYSSLAGSSLEIIATLMLGSNSNAPNVSVNKSDHGSYDETLLIAEADDAAGDLVRESLIAGTNDLPVRIPSMTSEEFDMPEETELASPLELFDSRRPIRAPRLPGALDNSSRETVDKQPGVLGREDLESTDRDTKAVEESVRDTDLSKSTNIKERLSDDVEERQRLEQPAFASTPRSSNRATLLSLAFSVAYFFLVPERPECPRRERTKTKSRIA